MAPLPQSSAKLPRGSTRLVTVVSGLPRSGTSMMMQMLEAGGLEIASDGLRVADADNPRGYYELEAVKRIREDVSFVRDCVGKVVKIVAPLLPSLPKEYDYRVVFMERDLGQVLASQREMLKRRGSEGSAANDSALERAYRGQIEKVKDWIAGQNNIQTLFVSHRAAIEDPRSIALDVLDFLERAVRLPGSARDRSPLASSVEEMARVVDVKGGVAQETS